MSFGRGEERERVEESRRERGRGGERTHVGRRFETESIGSVPSVDSGERGAGTESWEGEKEEKKRWSE